MDQGLISRLERGADARWSTWARLFAALGYEISLTATPVGEDDVEDWIQDGIQRRKERMENGRLMRW